MDKLEEARQLTDQMRQLEQQIIDINRRRRHLIRDVWRIDGVSQRVIATRLGVTNQTVWNEIHRKESTDAVA